MKRASSVVYAAAFTMLLCSAAHSANIKLTPEIEKAGKLTISSNLAYAPFDYIDDKGKPAGMDIDLAQALADLLGVKLDIVSIPFANQISSLVAGKTDIAWSTFSVTPERLKQVDFVTFLTSSTVFVTKSATAARYPDQQSLCGAIAAIQAGSLADFVIDKLNEDCNKANKPEIRKAVFPEQKDTIQAVVTGRADGRFDDSTAAAYLESQTKGALVVTPGAYDPTPLGIAVRKGDHVAAEMMRAAFQQLIDSGAYRKIAEKYNMAKSTVKVSRIITKDAEIAE